METKRILALFLLIMLLAPMALAAVTVTVDSGLGSINNLPANVKDYVIEFTVTDNNTDVSDLNLNIKYYSVTDGIFSSTAVLTDANIWDWNANPTGNQSCTGTDWTSFVCKYNWRVPGHTTLGQGSYIMDVNVMDWTGVLPANEVNADANGEVAFAINNTIGSGDAIRSMITTMALVLIGVAIITGLVAVFAFKANPAQVATVVVIGSIAVGIVSMVAGAVLVTL